MINFVGRVAYNLPEARLRDTGIDVREAVIRELGRTPGERCSGVRCSGVGSPPPKAVIPSVARNLVHSCC
jgi:hypothetical protein